MTVRGQEHNRSTILDWLEKDIFPHFVVIVGPRGSGKTILTKYIAEHMKAVYSVSDIKVDAIRDIINTAYTINATVVYHIQNADNMRAEAKNALLKITEEPPKNAYFVMTLENDTNLLNTLKSRAQVMRIEPYPITTLYNYALDKYPDDNWTDLLMSIVSTPYDVDVLSVYDKTAFIDYVNLVIDNIGSVEPANAFKSANVLQFKDTEVDRTKFDLKLFFSAFVALCEQRIYNGQYDNKWADAVIVTTPYIDKVTKLGVNKQQLYDKWVFEIREVLNDNN